MIHSCEEYKPLEDPPTPDRYFAVVADEGTTAGDILRLIGRLPKMNETHPDKQQWPEYECWNLTVVPKESPGLFRVHAQYRPIADIAVASDEPLFPPYSGPVGKQPDGSFILSPRCLHYLEELFMHQWNRFQLPDYHDKYIEALQDAIHEDTGTSFGELT